MSSVNITNSNSVGKQAEERRKMAMAMDLERIGKDEKKESKKMECLPDKYLARYISSTALTVCFNKSDTKSRGESVGRVEDVESVENVESIVSAVMGDTEVITAAITAKNWYRPQIKLQSRCLETGS